MSRETTTKTKTRADDPLDSLRFWNKEREEELIGAVLFRPDLLRDVRAMVGPTDFHGYVTRTIYGAMLRLDDRNRPIDVDSLAEELQSTPDVPKSTLVMLYGGRYLMSPERVVDYARSVRDAGTRRRLVRVLDEARAGLIGDDEVETTRGLLYRALDDCDLRDRSPEADTFDALVMRLGSELQDVDRRPSTTCYEGLDKVCGGIARKTMVLIGARTSVGKTAFATSMAVEMARAGRRVSFVSVEMDALSIAMRYVGALGGISMSSLNRRELSDDELGRFVEVAAQPLPLCTDDSSRTLAQCRARVYQHKRLLGGLDVVFVDYLQLMDVDLAPGEKRYEGLGKLSRGLKRMAQDLDVTLIALCQLSRAADDRAKEPPRLSDLRESGDLEQDADQVWLLWRPPKTADNWAGRPVDVIVAKNRNGPTGTAHMRFQAGRMKFEEDADDDE